MFKLLAVAALFAAAFLEIHGDVMVGRGMKERAAGRIALGCGILAIYGITVNLYNIAIARRAHGPVTWDFTTLLGSYIACFALMNLLLGLYRSPKSFSPSTIAGTIIIAIGGAVIQWGSKFLG